MLIRFPSPRRNADDPGTPPPADPPAPAPAPAARVVVTSIKSERELSLESELEAERQRVAAEAERAKKAELAAMELKDENHRLRKAQLAPDRKKPAAASWGPVIQID